MPRASKDWLLYRTASRKPIMRQIRVASACRRHVFLHVLRRVAYRCDLRNKIVKPNWIRFPIVAKSTELEQQVL